ncbi:MAG TPA: hypothetical protein VEQ58_09960, partial [Polyangiaceae bacterium]|nr:hypothetical protein [Polyangiaceae bacterium]
LCWALIRRVSFGAALALFLSIGCLVAYRSSGSEPFSQWLMLPTTLACVFFFLWGLKEPSFKLLFVLLGLLWIPPALYIAGALNSAIFALALGVCLLRDDFRRRLWASEWKLPLGLFALWSAAQLLLIWKPYFSAVSLHDLRAVSKTAPSERVTRALLELVRIPLWLWTDAVNAEFRPSYYTDARIVSSSWFPFLGHAAQWLFRALLAVVVALGVRARIWQQRELWAWIYWPLLLLALALVCSPLLGGPCFTRGERADIGFQWICLVFLPIAVVLAAPGIFKPLRLAGYGLLLSFVAAQMAAGFITYGAHNRYKGDVLSEVDVPVRQKMAVVDTIVSEAKQRHLEGDLPIDYVVGGGIWNWIGRIRHPKLEQYGYPYTLGRAYDYDLDRRYGIKNSLEGRRKRNPSWGFAVNYRFEPSLKRPGQNFEREIGRLRVSFRPKRGS